MPEPSLSDIMEKLGGIASRIDSLNDKVEHTNGKVRKLEVWRAEVKAVEEDRKHRQPKVESTDTDWTQQTITKILAILGTIATLGLLLVQGVL